MMVDFRWSKQGIIFLVTIVFLLSLREVRAQEFTMPDDVTHCELKNGFTYYLVPHGEPGKIRLTLLSRIGSHAEKAHEHGYTHFLEHMVFKGSKSYPGDSIVNTLAQMGLLMGKEYNAFVNSNLTQFHLTLPENNETYLQSSLKIMSEWIHDLEFDPVSLETEKKVVIEEIKRGGGGNPSYLLGTHLGTNNSLGTIDEINSVDRDSLYVYYREHFTTDAMALIITGNLNPEKAHDLVRKTFGSLKASQLTEEAGYPDLSKKTFVEAGYTSKLRNRNTTLAIAYKEPSFPVDSYEGLKRDLINNLVCSVLEHRLKSRFNTAGKITVNTGSVLPGTAMYNIRIGGPETLDYRTRLEGFRAVVGQLLQFGAYEEELDFFTKELLDTYKSRIHENKTGTNDVKMHFLLGDIPLSGAEKYRLAKKVFSELNPDAVNKVLRNMIGLEKTVLYDGTSKAGDKDFTKEYILNTIGRFDSTGYEKPAYLQPRNNFALRNKVKEKNPDFNAEFGASIAPVANRELSGGMYLLEFDNGLKVVLYNSRSVKPVVRMISEAGLNAIPIQDRLKFKNAIGLLDGGAGVFDSNDWNDILRNAGISIRREVSGYQYVMEASSRTGEMEPLLQAFNLSITAAWLEEDNEVLNYYNRFHKQGKGLDTDSYESSRNFLLGETLPMSNDTLITPEEVRTLWGYEKKLRENTQNTIVYVGGDLPENIDELISKYIGSIQASQTNKIPQFFNPETIPEGRVTASFPESGGGLAKVDIIFSLDPKDELTMKDQLILYGVSQYARSRIFEVLRRKYGLIYAFGETAYTRNYPYSYQGLSLRYMLDPVKIDTSLKIVRDEILTPMSSGVLSNYDAERIKAIIGSKYLIYYYDEERIKEQYPEWLQQYGTAYSYDQLQKLIDSITPEEITSAMKEITDRDNYHILLLKPRVEPVE